MYVVIVFQTFNEQIKMPGFVITSDKSRFNIDDDTLSVWWLNRIPSSQNSHEIICEMFPKNVESRHEK